MNSRILLLLGFVALAAAPKPTKLHFRNMYKEPVGAARATHSPRIVGGQEAERNSIPYQAFLEMYTDEKGWYCSGSLISENYILTAGHCGVDAVEAHVTLGAHRPLHFELTQAKILSTQILVHEAYDAKETINDIALIKLPEPVALNTVIQPVSLPNRANADNTYVGVSARASGWGMTDGFNATLSDVLNYVDSDVISHSKCEEDYGDLAESIICISGEQNTSICGGDSGGPLTVDGVQVGVASFGIIFCFAGFASGFTRVTSFLDWIDTNSDVQIA